MNKAEELFDINIVLMTLFSSLETISDENKIDLIYDMEATVPKELRGDSEVLLRLLTKMLTFVLQNSDRKEIVLSLGAPEDFLYEELMSFRVEDTNIAKEKVLEFLETDLTKDLEILDGKILYEETSDIHLDIPFKINELGYRRHYRVPDVAMLGKKVLLFCEGEETAKSIKKMFKYFLYDVDMGFDAFKRQGNDLTPYDILIVEDKLVTPEFERIIAGVQKNIPLKYVPLQDPHAVKSRSIRLIKPVTEEGIFELIVSLFKKNSSVKYTQISQEKKNIIDIEKLLQTEKRNLNEMNMGRGSLAGDNLHAMIEKKKGLKLPILDRAAGEENTKKVGSVYSYELKNFLDTFDHSDIYFRKIVNEKSTHKIKEFRIGLEKQAKLIGAQSMLNFSDILSLIFTHNKLDMLPIYPGRYHIELQELIQEIKSYLRI